MPWDREVKMPGRKRNRKTVENKAPKEYEAPLREKITDMLELPKDVVLNMPRITMVGSVSLVMENYRGIVEYGDEKIRINTGSGLVRIMGNRLVIREITSENVFIEGDIKVMEFIR